MRKFTSSGGGLSLLRSPQIPLLSLFASFSALRVLAYLSLGLIMKALASPSLTISSLTKTPSAKTYASPLPYGSYFSLSNSSLTFFPEMRRSFKLFASSARGSPGESL
jgi:hypothetical protein